MVMNSTPVMGERNSSQTPLIVNTSSFNSADLTNFISLNEEIERMRSTHRSRSYSTIKATKTREELFECSTLDDDAFLTALEYQGSYVPRMVTDLDDSQSIENLMKYFDEAVSLADSPSGGNTPTMLQPAKQPNGMGKVASVLANLKTKTMSMTPSPQKRRKKYKPELRANVQELKRNFESDPITAKAAKAPRYANIKELKTNFENIAATKCTKTPKYANSPKVSRKFKVKHLAQMFNDKITQIMRRDTGNRNYAPLENEFSPEPKPAPRTVLNTIAPPVPKPRTMLPAVRTSIPSPRLRHKQFLKTVSNSPTRSPRLKRKQSQRNTCLIAEDVFNQLSVKDKALLYNKFIEDMSHRDPQFNKHAQLIEERVRKEFAQGEVVSEKQQSVKQLAHELEAKFGNNNSPKRLDRSSTLPNRFPTAPPTPHPRKSKQTTDASIAKTVHEEMESLHVSTLTVVLKTTPDKLRREQFQSEKRKERNEHLPNILGIVEPSCKRTNRAIRSSVPYEVYAPPKKIRRTHDDRLSPKMFFRDQILERLFYSWLKEKNGVVFDITPVHNHNETIDIAPEQEQEVSANSVDTEAKKSAVDRLLEEAITKLEKVDISGKSDKKETNSVEEKEVDTALQMIKDAMTAESTQNTVVELELPLAATPICQPAAKKVKKPAPAPPVPAKKTALTSESSTTSSAKQSDVEESESGLSSMPKITSSESLPELHLRSVAKQAEEFEFAELIKPAARKKKLRRTLTWKKEHSIIEANPVQTTDSESDNKQTSAENKSSPTSSQPSIQHSKRNTLPNLSLQLESPSLALQAQKQYAKRTTPLNLSLPKEQQHQQAESCADELDEKLMRAANSPRKIKSAYTLTVVSSPSPYNGSDYDELESPLTPPFHNNSEAWSSATLTKEPSLDPHYSQPLDRTTSTEATLVPGVQQKQQPLHSSPHPLTDSYIDQGFETGSNEMDSPTRFTRQVPLRKRDKSVSPFWIKLHSELEESRSRCRQITQSNKNIDHTSYSTPVKGRLGHSLSFTAIPGTSSTCPTQHQLFSPITSAQKSDQRRRFSYDPNMRRSSIAMDIIREDHLWNQSGARDRRQSSSPESLNGNESAFFANAPTIDMMSSTNLSMNDELGAEKCSVFWIAVGDLKVCYEVFHITPNRVRLLHEIFRQKSCETRDIHFGIDDHQFSTNNPADKISKRLPREKGCSHYWFATGDCAIPFSGNYLTGNKIKRLFKFVSESLEDSGSTLRFGVDDFDFSNVSDYWQQSSPKLSMESSYSMLVGLQTGKSNGLEGRSKYAWPNSKSISPGFMKTSDLDHSEFDSEEFGSSELDRLSYSPFSCNRLDLSSLDNDELNMPRNSDAMLSPDLFGLSYENEPLDQIFQKCSLGNPVHGDIKTVPEMLQTLHDQKDKLKSVANRIKAINLPTNMQEQCKDSPDYLRKLQNIISAIENIARDNGFKACSPQQLESFMFLLSRYADKTLDNCNAHMDQIIEVLQSQRAVQV